MALWGGRFGQAMNQQAWNFNASIEFDFRLASQDIRGSQAWAKALAHAGVLTDSESNKIISGLDIIHDEFIQDRFDFMESDEDIHTAVERRLGDLIGPVAGKLHTGRSRNDQVATDLRLWLLDSLPVLEQKTRTLQAVLVEKATEDFGVFMPGYTHLQRAQPVLLSHWWLSHFWPLQRDRTRLLQIKERCAILPLGSGALAGTGFPVDRKRIADDLGFSDISANSMDAVSDRDFVAEFLFWAALTGAHLSKLAEAVVIFTSSEFQFLELDDAFSTGSSLMPQKKNADIFELTRGKAGSLLGTLTGFMAVIKGLPSAYDKDLQEDKKAIFTAFDTLNIILSVLADALKTIQTKPNTMEQSVSPAMMATDLADYLVGKGVPFRDAHTLTGQAVKMSLEKGITLAAITLEDFQSISPLIAEDVYEIFNVLNCLNHHNVAGGAGPAAVQEQIKLATQILNK